MRVGYADPPYPGQAKLYGRGRDPYTGDVAEVDHEELIGRLELDFPDGWALSTSSAALGYVLSLCPFVDRASELRVCAWVRGTVPRPPQRIMWSWEPLIVRTPNWRQRHEGDFIRDTLTSMQPSGFLGGQIKGAKPREFSTWMFNLLGLSQDDVFVDLFPGSGAVTNAWQAWRAQGRLVV